MKDTLIEIKNNLQGINSRVDEAKNQINDLEHRKKTTLNQNSKKKKRIQKNEDRLRSLWDNFKHSNIRIIRVVGGEEEEQETENIFDKIMKEHFPNLAKEIDIQVQEAQRVPNKMDPKRTTSRHIIIKMPKVKDRES